jgi:pyruvate,orthophosphate dikinase
MATLHRPHGRRGEVKEGEVITRRRLDTAMSCMGAVPMVAARARRRLRRADGLGRQAPPHEGARQRRNAARLPRTARQFGAEGIGLCRTEHMFFDAERVSSPCAR